MRRVPHALAAPLGAAALALAPAAAAADWSAPVRVSPADRAGYGSPAVAAGPGGAALAAWVRVPAGGEAADGRVQAVARPAGGRWSRPRLLSGPGASAPSVALNARGHAVAAWLNGRLVVGAVRPGPRAPWRPGRIGGAGAPVQELRVSIDRRGRPTAAWIERGDGGYRVRLATADAAGADWAIRAARLTTPGPAPPALALSPGRGAVAAWVDGDRVLASRTVAGAFERPVEMSDSRASAPGIALGGSGAAIVSWAVRLPGGSRVLQAAGRPATAPRWRSAEDVGIGGDPVVAVNEAGDAVVAWGSGEPGGEQTLEASTRPGGGLWRASTILAPTECDCELRAAGAAVDGAGRAVVSWRRENGETGGGGVASLAADGDRWQRARIRTARLAGAPAVGAAPTGGTVAAWAVAGAGGGVRAARDGG
jgi:hypothetical protein